MDLEKICDKVKELAFSVGTYLREEQAALMKKDVELKGTRNYVTYIDKEAENRLVEGLRELIPGAGFLTEEGTVGFEQKEFTWIIDPLDGTTNYVHGDSPFSVSIALIRGKETVLGVVYDPLASQMYCATGARKVFLNDHPITVSSQSTLVNGYIGFGIPYSLDERGEKILENAMKQFRKCSFRIKGSAALEICYVAAGVSDAYFHSGLSPWDVAAGAFILQCAGGKCTDFSGGDNYIFDKELVASNGIIHQEVMETIIQGD
ncbi:inositol monophosphatase family protein [Proteiniphilum sp.]|uniref:inositol monophosphatase family protein n=1 Tax=Proteiniphilum sp. TaxID=1926877 RepID=UPI003322FB34